LEAALIAARSPAAALAVGGSGAQAPSAPAQFGLGDALPAQSVSLLGGPSFSFRPTGAERPTVLVFLSPWCESYLATTRPAVAANCRSVRETVNTRARDQRVRCLGIASGLWAMPEDLRKYRQDYKIAIPLTLDASGTLFREFRVNDVPTVIVADAAGRIVQRLEPSDANGLRQALDALYAALGGRAP
jgi:hypothetical protein